MAKYRLTNDAYIDGKLLKKGMWIRVSADHVPADGWVPLDPEAEAAVARHQRPWKIAQNGVQCVDRVSGQVVGVGAPGPLKDSAVAPPKKAPKAPPPQVTRPPIVTAAGWAKQREKVFRGKPLPTLTPAGDDAA